jgi:hypothetical protein
MKLSLLPKLVEKLVWVSVISFCKISFPVTHLMPYYVETGRSHPLIKIGECCIQKGQNGVKMGSKCDMLAMLKSNLKTSLGPSYFIL